MSKLFVNKKVAEAFEFMVVAHEGQKYGNMPYFTHPLAVAELMNLKFIDSTPDDLIIALLHDVLEDTDRKLLDLVDRYGEYVATGVRLLTKNNLLSYEENIARIIHSNVPAYMKVKWCDNKINFNGDKSDMPAVRRIKLQTRYKWSMETLEQHMWEMI